MPSEMRSSTSFPIPSGKNGCELGWRTSSRSATPESRWRPDHLAAQHRAGPPRTRCVLEPTTALVVVAVALLASAAQGLTGFGFALVIVPFLLLAVDVRETVVISTLLGIASTGLLMARLRRHVLWPLALRLLAGSVGGMRAGLAILLLVREQARRFAVAAIVLGMWRRWPRERVCATP